MVSVVFPVTIMLLTSPGAPWSWHQTLVHVYTVIPASVTSRPRRTKDHSKYYSAVIIITEDILTKMTEEYLLAWNDHHATFFSAMSDLVTGNRERMVFECLRSVLIISGDDMSICVSKHLR